MNTFLTTEGLIAIRYIMHQSPGYWIMEEEN